MNFYSVPNLSVTRVFPHIRLYTGSWPHLGSGPHLQGRVPLISGSPAPAGLQSLWLCSCLSPMSLLGENAQASGGVRETGWGGRHRQPCERADQGGPHPEAVRQERHHPGPPPLPGEPPSNHTSPAYSSPTQLQSHNPAAPHPAQMQSPDPPGHSAQTQPAAKPRPAAKPHPQPAL